VSPEEDPGAPLWLPDQPLWFMRLTTRLRAKLDCWPQQRCASEGAGHHGASWAVVHAAFVEHVRVPMAAALPPVTVLGCRRRVNTDSDDGCGGGLGRGPTVAYVGGVAGSGCADGFGCAQGSCD
jgi:hypothetical protein